MNVNGMTQFETETMRKLRDFMKTDRAAAIDAGIKFSNARKSRKPFRLGLLRTIRLMYSDQTGKFRREQKQLKEQGMETKQHTGRSWHASALRINGANPDMDGCDIGADDGANVGVILYTGDAAETLANARLAAAAPRLLKALQAYVRSDNDLVGQAAERRRDDAVEAIKLAIGRKS